MSIKHLLITNIFVFAICFQSFSQQSTKEDLPNIIVILVDDMGWGDFGQKEQRISTPNLDRLASEGMKLTSFYAASSLCSPTRASLLTGRYPHSVGVPDLASPNVRGDVPILALDHAAVTIPEALKPLGYKSMLAGKWHLGYYKENWPRKHGFDEYWGSLIGTPRFYDVAEVYHNEDSVKVDKYFTDWITDKSIDFLRKEKDNPFFLYLAYNAPHYPLEAPARLVTKYRKLYPEDGLYAIYAAMIEQLDHGVGRVMQELEKLNLSENTIIIFTSDNGPSAELMSYGLPGAKISRGPLNGHKFSMHEGGIRVPFIAKWSGKIPKGTVRSELATTMDIMPTILQAVGLEPKSHKINGVSMIPLLTNQPYQRSEYIHWENAYNMAVRKGDWKLIYQFWEDSPRLYNLANDLGERHDVSKENPKVVKDLMAAHEKWLKEYYPNQIPREKVRPLGRIPIK